MEYYQFRREGMPRYTYLTDKDTNFIRARIRLPDGRVFVGDPCADHGEAAGNVAKKVYEVLNSFVFLLSILHYSV